MMPNKVVELERLLRRHGNSFGSSTLVNVDQLLSISSCDLCVGTVVIVIGRTAVPCLVDFVDHPNLTPLVLVYSLCNNFLALIEVQCMRVNNMPRQCRIQGSLRRKGMQLVSLP